MSRAAVIFGPKIPHEASDVAKKQRLHLLNASFGACFRSGTPDTRRSRPAYSHPTPGPATDTARIEPSESLTPFAGVVPARCSCDAK